MHIITHSNSSNRHIGSTSISICILRLVHILILVWRALSHRHHLHRTRRLTIVHVVLLSILNRMRSSHWHQPAFLLLLLHLHLWPRLLQNSQPLHRVLTATAATFLIVTIIAFHMLPWLVFPFIRKLKLPADLWLHHLLASDPNRLSTCWPRLRNTWMKTRASVPWNDKSHHQATLFQRIYLLFIKKRKRKKEREW
ncbi:hypothetical protein BCR43DRAFT_482762 [Syncephalastrum racemosum]|uniref:Uncharacterized protein n=1 Tax=Syncephalastrum racemosum TaxID=13706 RepID=A0A1X2HUB2_SYNRA|nr:hypothetical protein BCR43DRAFT_482762 [Syncephalastrum racemosum]